MQHNYLKVMGKKWAKAEPTKVASVEPNFRSIFDEEVMNS